MEYDLDMLVKQLAQEIVDGTVIDGGHYFIDEEEGGLVHVTNPYSTATFEVAVRLYAISKGKAKLSFLVDDLAIDPERRTVLKEEFVFPEEYEAIIRKYEARDDILFFYESRLRNRAKRMSKKMIKEGKVIMNESSLYTNPAIQADALLISNKTLEREKIVPNCRMMLCQELYDKESMGFRKAINIYNEEVFECRGSFAKVYHTLLEGSMDVTNIYFLCNGDVEIQKYEGRK